MQVSRAVRRCAIPAGIAGATWLADETYGHKVLQRTLRAVHTGAFLLWEYKVRWSPADSEDIHARVSNRLVECIRKNEGLYVKFGQAMATMDVILPEAYKKELRTLHDQAATFSFSEVRQVVESELQKPLEEVFPEFEEKPIASASIAQVHRAKLKDGTSVAVKIQKPNIPAQNGCDLAVYKIILRVLEYSFDLPLSWTYDYTRQQLEAELDFRIEARNARRAAHDIENCPHLKDRVIVPRVYDEASGQRVMAMEWIDSIGAVSDSAALKSAGFNSQDIMKTATQVFGHQIFSTGHVHCDPHPGNLLVREAPLGSSMRWQLVLLDHGLYCELPSHLRQQYADFWVAATLGDGRSTVEICRKWGIADEDAAELFASLTQFRRVRLGSGRLGAVSSLFNHGNQSNQKLPNPHQHGHMHRKMTPEEMAAAQAALKARAKKVLGDTKAFPQELFFVGRNLNIIRSANFQLGSVVNRIAILAECAAVGSVHGGGSFASMNTVSRNIVLLKFHARVRSLLVADRLMRTYQFAHGWMAWWRDRLLKLYSTE